MSIKEIVDRRAKRETTRELRGISREEITPQDLIDVGIFKSVFVLDKLTPVQLSKLFDATREFVEDKMIEQEDRYHLLSLIVAQLKGIVGEGSRELTEPIRREIIEKRLFDLMDEVIEETKKRAEQRKKQL